jgi:predicted NACHT family NTPase
MLDHLQEAGANKLIDSVERIYAELKEEWNYQTKDKIKRYLQNMILRHGEVKTILHGNNPMPFYEVYFPLSLSINGRFIASDTTPSLFRRRQALIITADAGSGKSMLVKHLFNSTIKTSYMIPFAIELRYLNSSNVTLDKFIDAQISLHITESARIKKRLLEEGRLIFFFDGYDEVKKDLKQDVVRSLKEMHERYTKCKFLISTRPYTDLEMLSNLSTIQIKPLSTTEVEGFIRQQIQDSELSSIIIKSVSDADQSKFSSFLKNPLLLTLYILTYKNSSEIPSKASVFYRRVIDSLFIEHDSKTKVGFQREKRSGIS